MKILTKFQFLKKIDLIQYMKLYFNQQITGKKIYPYKNCCFQLSDSAKIIIKSDGALHLNCGKIGKSKIESLLRMDSNTQFIVNGCFNIFYGCDIAVYNGASLSIGSGFINAGGEIRCGKSITIGNNVAIGRNFYIQDSDFHTIIEEDGSKRINSLPIVIEDNVWIGANVVILKGVHIGEGSVIGAGTLITKNVPAHSIIAGNPNRILRKKINWK